MKVRSKIAVSHEKIPSEYTTKRLDIAVTLSIEAVKGEPVVGTIQATLAAANKAIVDVASRY